MIAEQTARLLLGVGLASAGMGVTGAYLGTPLARVVTAGVLGVLLQSRLGTRDRDTQPRGLRQLALDARTAIGGLALIAILQNIDLIVAQHRFDKGTAGTYAQVAVAAKVVVWVAIGIGFYLLPEAARKHSENEDARPVLIKALAMTGAVAAPCLLIYSFAPNILLKLAFGPKYSGNGGQALFELGAAMALLSVCYLAVQLLLALGESKFLIGLAIIAIAEPAALLTIPGENDINGFATTVLVIQAIAASGALIAAYRASAAPPESFSERDSSAVHTPNRATST
jgi:O-antigen/teichoic acid export membrane protein